MSETLDGNGYVEDEYSTDAIQSLRVHRSWLARQAELVRLAQIAEEDFAIRALADPYGQMVLSATFGEDPNDLAIGGPGEHHTNGFETFLECQNEENGVWWS